MQVNNVPENVQQEGHGGRAAFTVPAEVLACQIVTGTPRMWSVINADILRSEESH
jgi:hypothetical protein